MQSEKNYAENLHSSAHKTVFENARSLRKKETPAEKLLWAYLRNRKLAGLKFRRQHAFDKYILDFYCHEKKLVVELDGDIHDETMNKDYDRARTEILNEAGISVIRFRNEEVMNDVKSVLDKIVTAF